jgi:hypothetical protein
LSASGCGDTYLEPIWAETTIDRALPSVHQFIIEHRGADGIKISDVKGGGAEP